MPDLDQQVEEILTRDRATWTKDEAILVDYIYCLTSEGGNQIKPYQELPSGNYLHNPAQKTLESAAAMSKKLIDNAGQRGDAWVAGMNHPSRDPIKAAIDNVAKYYDKLAKAKAAGKWEKNLGKVNSADIIATVNKLGSSVFTSGIAAREAKITAAFAKLQPKLQAVSNAIQAMPNGTDGEREARMLSNLKLMRAIGGT